MQYQTFNKAWRKENGKTHLINTLTSDRRSCRVELLCREREANQFEKRERAKRAGPVRGWRTSCSGADAWEHKQQTYHFALLRRLTSTNDEWLAVRGTPILYGRTCDGPHVPPAAHLARLFLASPPRRRGKRNETDRTDGETVPGRAGRSRGAAAKLIASEYHEIDRHPPLQLNRPRGCRYPRAASRRAREAAFTPVRRGGDDRPRLM